MPRRNKAEKLRSTFHPSDTWAKELLRSLQKEKKEKKAVKKP